MKKIALSLIVAGALLAQPYTVEPAKSSVGFTTSKFFVVGVTGKFSNFSGTVDVESGKITAINGIVNVASVDTAEAKRDEHLRAEDYFSAKVFPEMRFVSTSISGNTVKGNLTIKNITKPLTLKLSNVAITDTGVSLQLAGETPRKDYGLDGSMSFVIDNAIKINVALSAKPQ